jgi:hypothetical protein
MALILFDHGTPRNIARWLICAEIAYRFPSSNEEGVRGWCPHGKL